MYASWSQNNASIFNTRIKLGCHTQEEARVALLSELCLLQRRNEFESKKENDDRVSEC
jgi:hypothetical protein